MGGKRQIKGGFCMKTQKSAVFAALVAVLPNMIRIGESLCHIQKELCAIKS